MKNTVCSEQFKKIELKWQNGYKLENIAHIGDDDTKYGKKQMAESSVKIKEFIRKKWWR